MEPDELKSIWQSFRPNLGEIKPDADIKPKSDIKSRLQRRTLWNGILTWVCLGLLCTSYMWAPVKIPSWWLVAFCVTIFTAGICEARIYLLIRKINLWSDTAAGILSAMIRIKRLYKTFELVFSSIAFVLLAWLSLIPPMVNTPRMYLAWVVMVPAFACEFIIYRSNIKHLNNLADSI